VTTCVRVCKYLREYENCTLIKERLDIVILYVHISGIKIWQNSKMLFFLFSYVKKEEKKRKFAETRVYKSSYNIFQFLRRALVFRRAFSTLHVEQQMFPNWKRKSDGKDKREEEKERVFGVVKLERGTVRTFELLRANIILILFAEGGERGKFYPHFVVV